MKTKNINIISTALNEGKFCYICECSIEGIEKLEGKIFKFTMPCNILEDDVVEVYIPDELLSCEREDLEILTNIERYWIEGRYLDCNGRSSRCARIKQGKRYMTLVNKYPNIYINNKTQEQYYVIYMNVDKKFILDTKVAIPMGFVKAADCRIRRSDV